MRWAEEFAASPGIKQVALDHWLANSGAQMFFSRMGFSLLKVIMRKDLSAAD
jgi:hypothetical protein